MGAFRDDLTALRAQLTTREAHVAHLSRRLERVEAERRDAVEALTRRREGVAEEDQLDDDHNFRRSLRAFGLLALVGGLVATVVVGFVLVATFESPLLTWRGVHNALFHLRHAHGLLGVLGSGAVLLAASPWVLLPAVGAIGLRRRRRWGYVMSLLGCVAWLPTPLLPVALFALVTLSSEQTRRVFFARPTEAGSP